VAVGLAALHDKRHLGYEYIGLHKGFPALQPLRFYQRDERVSFNWLQGDGLDNLCQKGSVHKALLGKQNKTFK
jgi:hypothetical protein